MQQHAQWVNKYSFEQELYHPKFYDDGQFMGVEKKTYLSEVQLFQRPSPSPERPCFRRTYIMYKFAGESEWLPEEELFASREEALDYARKQVQSNLDNLNHSLSEIEKQANYEQEKHDREDSE